MQSIKYIILILLVLLLLIFDLSLGKTPFTLSELYNAFFSSNSKNTLLLYEFRLPRVLAALLSGAALSLSGLMMQSIFRNALAGPYILGISSGSSLGVAFLLMGSALFPQLSFMFNSAWSIIIASFLGALSVLMLLFLVSAKTGNKTILLLFGIIIGSAFGAIINVLQYYGKQLEVKNFAVWMMGSFYGIYLDQIAILSGFVIIGFALAITQIKALNATLLGDWHAESMGINLQKMTFIVLLSTALLSGGITAFCGPIAFVGIAVPHIAKMAFRTVNHNQLFLSVTITGACFMLFADILSQIIANHFQALPINSLSAILGAPIILWVLFKNRFIKSHYH